MLKLFRSVKLADAGDGLVILRACSAIPVLPRVLTKRASIALDFLMLADGVSPVSWFGATSEPITWESEDRLHLVANIEDAGHTIEVYIIPYEDEDNSLIRASLEALFEREAELDESEEPDEFAD